MSKVDVSVKQVSKQQFLEYQASQLILELQGKEINEAVVNTLRRLSLEFVPTYSFSDKTINIEENSSIFPDDYMKLRLCQLTIPELKVPVSYLPDKYWKDVDFADPERERHPNDKSNYELYII